MITDFSRLEAKAKEKGILIMVTRCSRVAALPGVIMVPAGSTQAEIDALAQGLARRTA